MEHAQGTTATLEAGHRGAGGVHGEEGERGEAHARRAQAEDDQAEDAQEVAARRGVGVACNFCRRSHTLCETKRPCTRCEKAGRAHLCADVPLRKRGRPRRSDQAAAAADVSAAGNSNPKTTSDVAHRHQRRLITTATPIPTTATAVIDNPQQLLATAGATSARPPSTSGFDSLPFYALSPRSPAGHNDAFTGASIRQQQAPQPPPLMPRPPLAGASGLYANALDMMSDELRRAREENEKLRTRLKKTKSKLKLKKFEALQLRRSLERELEDKARRLSSEADAATSESTARAAKHARIVATPASMRSTVHSFSSPSPSSSSASSSLSSPSDSSHSPPTHTSPSSSTPPAASYAASSLAPYSPPPASVSSYSTLHKFPLTIMQHVHEHMPFLASYIFSPRDFVIQDLRQPFLSIWSADWSKPHVTYSNPAFNQLLGFVPEVPLSGYPLLKLWADSENCEAGMEALMRNKPPMYVSEFIFAEPLLRCANGGPTIRFSFIMQFFFDRCGMIEHGVACAQSWRFDSPRKGESFARADAGVFDAQPLPQYDHSAATGAAHDADFGLGEASSCTGFSSSQAPLPDGYGAPAEVLDTDWSAPASQQCQFQHDADRMLLEDISMLLSDETSAAAAFLMRP